MACGIPIAPAVRAFAVIATARANSIRECRSHCAICELAAASNAGEATDRRIRHQVSTVAIAVDHRPGERGYACGESAGDAVAARQRGRGAGDGCTPGGTREKATM